MAGCNTASCEEREVIYCQNCKWFQIPHWCSNPALIRRSDGPISRATFYADGREHNVNNDCTYYQKANVLRKVANHIWPDEDWNV